MDRGVKLRVIQKLEIKREDSETFNLFVNLAYQEHCKHMGILAEIFAICNIEFANQWDCWHFDMSQAIRLVKCGMEKEIYFGVPFNRKENLWELTPINDYLKTLAFLNNRIYY